MNIKNPKIMDIDEAINYIKNSIVMDNDDIIVNTEFGRLVVEVNHEDYGPETNVIVEDWSFAPDTVNMLDIKADYYICIVNPVSDLSLHLKVVEAIYRVMFKNMIGVDIDDEVADAAVMIYRRDHEKKQYNVNLLMHDFLRYNLNILSRRDDMVKWLVRDRFERKIKDAKRVIGLSCNLFDNEYSDIVYDVINNDKFSRKIFGLILYVAKENGINILNQITTTEQKAFFVECTN